MSSDQVAVVTGSNQGIGFEIVKALCSSFHGLVYLTSRDIIKGEAAVAKLSKVTLSLNVRFHQLDILDKNSIDDFAAFLKNEHGGINILINNAAIAYRVDSPEPFGEQAEVCLATNYFGLVAVCEALFPLLRPHARVVNLASSEGHLSKIPGQNIRDRLSNPDLTLGQLNDLVHEFIDSAKAGTYNETGWGRSSYRVSKNAVCALTFLQQRGFDRDLRPDIVVNAVHPGHCRTNMTQYKAALDPSQGVEAPVFLGLLPPNVAEPRGQFVWKDCTVISWTKPLKEPF